MKKNLKNCILTLALGIPQANLLDRLNNIAFPDGDYWYIQIFVAMCIFYYSWLIAKKLLDE